MNGRDPGRTGRSHGPCSFRDGFLKKKKAETAEMEKSLEIVISSSIWKSTGTFYVCDVISLEKQIH